MRKFITQENFHEVMAELANALGLEYEVQGNTGTFDDNPLRYPSGLIAQLRTATYEAKSLKNQYSRLQSDLQLVLNYLKLQITTYPETKKVEKVKKAK